jgi:hypothetical protein
MTRGVTTVRVHRHRCVAFFVRYKCKNATRTGPTAERKVNHRAWRARERSNIFINGRLKRPLGKGIIGKIALTHHTTISVKSNGRMDSEYSMMSRSSTFRNVVHATKYLIRFDSPQNQVFINVIRYFGTHSSVSQQQAMLLPG